MSLMSWSSKAEDMAQQAKFQFMQGMAKQNPRSASTAYTHSALCSTSACRARSRCAPGLSAPGLS